MQTGVHSWKRRSAVFKVVYVGMHATYGCQRRRTEILERLLRGQSLVRCLRTTIYIYTYIYIDIIICCAEMQHGVYHQLLDTW